jgi:hypothetical protein
MLVVACRRWSLSCDISGSRTLPPAEFSLGRSLHLPFHMALMLEESQVASRGWIYSGLGQGTFPSFRCILVILSSKPLICGGRLSRDSPASSKIFIFLYFDTWISSFLEKFTVVFSMSRVNNDPKVINSPTFSQCVNAS